MRKSDFLPSFAALPEAGRVWHVRQTPCRRAESPCPFWFGGVWEICLPKGLCSASHCCSRAEMSPQIFRASQKPPIWMASKYWSLPCAVTTLAAIEVDRAKKKYSCLSPP